MRLQLWLTKDPSFGDPVPISEVAERGRYVVFDYVNWQRESVSIPSPVRFLSIPSPPYHPTCALYPTKLTPSPPQRDLVIAWSDLDTHITNRQNNTLRS